MQYDISAWTSIFQQLNAAVNWLMPCSHHWHWQDNTVLSYLVGCVNRTGDKSRLFSVVSPQFEAGRIVSKFSVADSLALSSILFALLTRSRQHSLVLMVSAVWTSHKTKAIRHPASVPLLLFNKLGKRLSMICKSSASISMFINHLVSFCLQLISTRT